MITDALRTGLDRTRACAKLVWLVYGLNVAIVLPLAAALAEQLSESIGPSVVGETMLRGFDHLWFRGFDARAHGIGTTFEPWVVGIGGVLEAIDDLVTGVLLDLHPSIVAAGVVYLVAWVFLSAGFLARFVSGDHDGFLHGAARHFPRVLVLAATSWVVYAIVLAAVLPLLADIVEAATYESVDERVHFAWTVAKYGVLWAIVWTAAVVFDYAKIAAVARPDEPLRRCLRRSLRLVRTRPRAVYGLSAALLALGVGVVAAYAVVAPGADQHNGFKIGIAFLISQTYILARIALRVLGIAARVRLASALEIGPASAPRA
jgi:hypothetical protein